MAEYQEVPWTKLQPYVLRTWEQGEHVMVNGPTGVGKTTLIAGILPARRYVIFFVTKIYDKTISNSFKDYEIIHEWPPKFQHERILLWPKVTKNMGMLRIAAEQKRVFTKAMDGIFTDLNWALVFDEQNYICKDLGLETQNKMFQHQGRSSGLSCINGAQRPAFVPLITMSGSTHYFLWKNTLKADLDRLSDIGGVDKREIAENMLTLSKHQFIYLNKTTGVAVRSQVERTHK